METRIHIRSVGRLVLQAKFRKALKIEAGDEIVLLLENDSIRLIPLHQAVSLAQKRVRKNVHKGTSLVDFLFQEWRDKSSQT